MFALRACPRFAEIIPLHALVGTGRLRGLGAALLHRTGGAAAAAARFALLTPEVLVGIT